MISKYFEPQGFLILLHYLGTLTKPNMSQGKYDHLELWNTYLSPQLQQL